MTVSIAVCCTEFEGIGVVIASSSIGVASRCAFVRTGWGSTYGRRITAFIKYPLKINV